MIRLLLSLFATIILLNFAQAKDLGIYLEVANKHTGDELYETRLKELGLNRKPYYNKYQYYNLDYHVTIARIINVKEEDVLELSKIINDKLAEKTQKTIFEFGAASLIGAKYLIAIPHNASDFMSLNNEIDELLREYKNGRYKLDKFTNPRKYLPHLPLNGAVGNHIPMENLSKALRIINDKLHEIKIPLSKLTIK